jgi:hypothetical protein
MRGEIVFWRDNISYLVPAYNVFLKKKSATSIENEKSCEFYNKRFLFFKIETLIHNYNKTLLKIQKKN